jgi:hypothetical protein
MANNWTREQLIVTFNLYCKIPFSKSVQGNSDVIRVANLIGRTPSAVAFKLGNFGSFDPELKKRGIGGLVEFKYEITPADMTCCLRAAASGGSRRGAVRNGCASEAPRSGCKFLRANGPLSLKGTDLVESGETRRKIA